MKNGNFSLEIVPLKKRNKSNINNDDTEGESDKSQDVSENDSKGSDDGILKIVAPEPTKG